jgi:hypothetical protein
MIKRDKRPNCNVGQVIENEVRLEWEGSRIKCKCRTICGTLRNENDVNKHNQDNSLRHDSVLNGPVDSFWDLGYARHSDDSK